MAAKATTQTATLYDVPVSNHGARIRMLIYGMGLEEHIAIQSPMELDEKGLKSEAFRALSPQGKMPLLVLPDGATIPESSAIANYVSSKYHGKDDVPSFLPGTAEEKAISDVLTCIHDNYISGIQGAMYKPMDAAVRSATLAEIAKQMDVMEHHIVAAPFAAGSELSLADASLFPTWVFFTYILPRKFGWDVFKGRPKLKKWWEAMLQHPVGAKIHEEVEGGLKKWDEGGRWDKLGITDQIKDSSHQWIY